MNEYVSLKKDEKAIQTVENLIANMDSPKLKDADRTFIKRLKGRRFIQQQEYALAKTLEAKL